jgi:hypothetical protein
MSFQNEDEVSELACAIQKEHFEEFGGGSIEEWIQWYIHWSLSKILR